MNEDVPHSNGSYMADVLRRLEPTLITFRAYRRQQALEALVTLHGVPLLTVARYCNDLAHIVEEARFPLNAYIGGPLDQRWQRFAPTDWPSGSLDDPVVQAHFVFYGELFAAMLKRGYLRPDASDANPELQALLPRAL